MLPEHPVLLRGRQSRVQGQGGDAGQCERVECLGGVADLPLPRTKHQDVLRATVGDRFAPQFLDRLHDARGLIDVDKLRPGLSSYFLDERPVAHLYRERAARHLDDRCGYPVAREMLGESARVDRRRGDDDFQVGPAREQLFEVPEDEVDVQRTLVRFVDDQRVVAAQVAVSAELGQQDAVGHHLDEAVGAGMIGEPHLVTDDPAERHLQLLRDPVGDRAGGDPARLGVPDYPGDPTPHLQQDLG